MNWLEIMAASKKLHEVGDGPITEAWQEFPSTVLRTADSPPYHLAILLNRIEQYRSARQKSDFLGRDSTAEEIAFLQEPDSSF